MSTAAGGTSSEQAWSEYERAVYHFNHAYERLSFAEKIRANRSVVWRMAVSLVIAVFFWFIPPIPFWFVMRLLALAQEQIIGSAFAQQRVPQQPLPIGVHIVIVLVVFSLLALGFLWSLHTVFRNPASTPAQRDIAKLFIGFFIGLGSRFFA
jgi:hypothetical protein